MLTASVLTPSQARSACLLAAALAAAAAVSSSTVAGSLIAVALGPVVALSCGAEELSCRGDELFNEFDRLLAYAGQKVSLWPSRPTMLSGDPVSRVTAGGSN